MQRGLFIALEGGEGVGKTTQAELLTSWLTDQGYQVLRTREPGATDLGAKLRAVLLDPATGSISHRAEALLYAADKADHVDSMILPALQRGEIVLTDRYVDSALAYQGSGRELVLDELEKVNRWATVDLRPDLTILIDLDPSIGHGRFGEPDRIEAESDEFHQRVRQAFLDLAAADPKAYIVVDGSKSPDEIQAEIQARVAQLFSGASQ